MHHQTGVSDQTFDLVLRSTKVALMAIHGHKLYQSGHVLMTAANLLLFLFYFLRHDPTKWQLSGIFHCAEGNAFELVEQVLDIVAPVLALYVRPPSKISHVIRTGCLKNAACFTDGYNRH
jgi:hypothetical protein